MKVDLEFQDQPKFKNQMEMFKWIWSNRPHVSELTGEPLLPFGHPQWHWQFLHVLPKGSYCHFKLYAKNILLGTPDEHNRQNQFDVFNEAYETLIREYYEKIYNKTYQS